PSASAHFDKEGLEIRGFVTAIPFVSQPPSAFVPDVATTTMRSSDFQKMVYSTFDARRQRDGRFLRRGETLSGIRGEGFARLRKLAHAIQRTEGLREFLSVDFVGQTIFDWLITLPQPEAGLMQYLLAQAAASVHDFEAWIPI